MIPFEEPREAGRGLPAESLAQIRRDLLRERVSAADACPLGLVTEVVEQGQALERALAHAQRPAGLPRLAVRVTGKLIDSMAEASRSAGLQLERLAYGLLAQTPEADASTARASAPRR